MQAGKCAGGARTIRVASEWRVIMKKFARKNQIIITALAVMIAVAGYLNFTGQEISKNGLRSVSTVTEQKDEADQVNTQEDAATEEESEETESATTDISAEDSGEDSYTVGDSGELDTASQENPGEAVMVSNTLGTDYFASAKLSREQSRAKNKETLMQIINNDKISSADKKSAIKQVAKLTEASELENAAELMLQAKGFADAVVSIDNENVDVIVNANELTQQQMAQIEDIVKRKTGVDASNIVITPVAVKDSASSSPAADAE